MGDLYTSETKIYLPGGDAVAGNTAISFFWKGVYRMGIVGARLDTIEAEPAGDQIIEVGNYTLYEANEAKLDKGKYEVVWKQENGNWKLHRDIWNTSISTN